jgi:periplasmic protein TonB
LFIKFQNENVPYILLDQFVSYFAGPFNSHTMRNNKKRTLSSILSILIFLQPLFALGQDTIFIDQYWNKVESIKNASYYKIVLYNEADSNRATEKVYFKSGKIKTQKDYAVYKNRKLDGKLKEWFESGQVYKDIDYKDGKKNGQLFTYWANGKLKRADRFENDSLIEGKCMTSEGTVIAHYEYEKTPSFPGGTNHLINYLRKEIKYPKNASRAGIEGRVLVRFVINTNGTISDIKITESVSQELDEEALRVVRKMPKWEPGMEDGEVIKSAVYLPIHFKLQ